MSIRTPHQSSNGLAIGKGAVTLSGKGRRTYEHRVEPRFSQNNHFLALVLKFQHFQYFTRCFGRELFPLQ